MIDLDQSVFVRSEVIVEENINSNSSTLETKNENKKTDDKVKKSTINNLIINKKNNEPKVLEIEENNNFYVKTLNSIKINSEILGYIMVTEQANEILIAVEERKNFILRTVFAITIAIFLFSIFLINISLHL